MPQIDRIDLSRVVSLDIPELDRSRPGFASRLSATVKAFAGTRNIRHVHLVGGGSSPDLATAITQEAKLPCTRSADPFAPARAGSRLRGIPCIDLGRTAIKIVERTTDRTPVPGHRTRSTSDVQLVDRDLVKAPLRDGAIDPALRDSTIDLIVSLLTRFTGKVLLGMPCSLAGGIVHASTYVWRDPDPDLLTDLAKRADRELEVCEAIELGALAAAENRLIPRTVPTLVLSVGLGVTGAVLTPD